MNADPHTHTVSSFIHCSGFPVLCSVSFSQLLIFFPPVVLGMELRAPCLLGPVFNLPLSWKILSIFLVLFQHYCSSFPTSKFQQLQKKLPKLQFTGVSTQLYNTSRRTKLTLSKRGLDGLGVLSSEVSLLRVNTLFYYEQPSFLGSLSPASPPLQVPQLPTHSLIPPTNWLLSM